MLVWIGCATDKAEYLTAFQMGLTLFEVNIREVVLE